MNPTLLEIRDLQIHFFTNEGVVRAVDGVDLTLKRGKTLCVVGESGCGKSAMALAVLKIVQKPGRIVAGEMLLHRHDHGSDTVTDIVQLGANSRELRQIRGGEIAMIFQEPMTAFSPMYSVGNQIGETIRLHEGASKREARDRTIELLRKVRIPKPERIVDEYPFRLSGGMRQRVMIAMALACNPSLLIADEPTTALDVTTQAQILDLLLELQQEFDTAVMFITHDLGVVAEIADEVAVMYLGKVVEIGAVDPMFNAPQHPYTKALLRSIPTLDGQRNTLQAIAGIVPSPFRRPGGCSFHPRCVQAVAGMCETSAPPVVAMGGGHQVRCVLYDQHHGARNGAMAHELNQP